MARIHPQRCWCHVVLNYTLPVMSVCSPRDGLPTHSYSHELQLPIAYSQASHILDFTTSPTRLPITLWYHRNLQFIDSPRFQCPNLSHVSIFSLKHLRFPCLHPQFLTPMFHVLFLWQNRFWWNPTLHGFCNRSRRLNMTKNFWTNRHTITTNLKWVLVSAMQSYYSSLVCYFPAFLLPTFLQHSSPVLQL